MAYLGIDYGDKKVGLAKAIRPINIATPFSILKNDGTIISELKRIIVEEEIDELVVGYPLTLKGERSEQTKKVEAFVRQLDSLPIPVHIQDERLSTRSAYANGADDASAAALILQTYIDAH